jgi:hypothetical protein
MTVIDRLRVITSHGVRAFVKSGGRLKFVPIEHDGAEAWLVRGITPEGEEMPIMLSRAGTPKILGTASAVYGYHKKMCPHEDAVLIPHHPRKSDTPPDDADTD